ncbi:hypothetical protein KGQ71_00965, partial [Patescibacteria group bacterium]|nr:hypothetical protein [Patescibacteria group bacterium]
GVFLPLDEAANPQIKTVFTTHATVLGRALSSRNVPIYDRLAGIDPDKSAKEVGVVSKHQLERLGARLATVFTTVSKITAEEAEAFLGRKVDVVVENGLDSQALPAFDDLCILRKRTREQVDDFIASYFFPSHQFDLAQTRYFFTMGRYEAHNKGYDLFLSSLGSLNKQLQTEKSSKTVISLFLVATGNSGLRPEVLSHLTVYNRMREIVRQKIQVEIPIYQAIWPDGSMNTDSFAQYTDQISALVRQLTRFDEVPISPYQIDPNDTIVQLALQNGLRNRAEDRVKVLFLPVYFDGLDGLFNIPIYELVSALDLGVFPSVYEPWGYTPLESIMMGVPAVSSTLAGFGRAVSEHTETYCEGVFVLDRSGKAAEDAGLKLTSYLKTGSDESDRQWLNRRIAAYLKAQSFGWNHLYRNYSRAYALAKAGETRKS